MSNSDTFQIGLCMAGAVSAGAYTAGVMDYLIEALDDWHRRKDAGEDNVPSHNLEIPVIGGASAGGMTGIITAAAIWDPIIPVRKLEGNIMSQVSGNKLYHSWVDLVSDNMLNIMLDNGDIRSKGLISALNSDFIERIANRAVKVTGDKPVKREYFSDGLRIFVTVSNLNGMSFSVTFRSNTPKPNNYVITSHNDYICFRLCNSENDYRKDGWIPLNFSSNLNTDLAKQAAMATGAFPVGLQARKIKRDSRYLNDLDWFSHITRQAGNPFGGDIETINVDGGMINNEPFENVRKVLMETSGQTNPEDFQNYDRFNSTVLMIDPFPSSNSVFNGTTGLTSVVGHTLGAMINQSRVKPSVLVDSMDSNKAGQFLISPARYSKDKLIEGPKAIACGSLDGFGGFISKEFRIHDFFLGRANCEKFLRDHFTVPAGTNNPIFKDGYSAITDKTPFTSVKDGGLQIIPIFTPRTSGIYMPVFKNGKPWPTVNEDYLNSYRKMIKNRVEEVVMNFTDYSTFAKGMLWLTSKVIINNKVADSVLKTLKKSLTDHDLLR